jgi:hypothetical protein
MALTNLLTLTNYGNEKWKMDSLSWEGIWIFSVCEKNALPGSEEARG